MVRLADDEEEAARQRLHNLGYRFYSTDAENVSHLEESLGLPMTGDLTRVAPLLEAWDTNGEPPEDVLEELFDQFDDLALEEHRQHDLDD